MQLIDSRTLSAAHLAKLQAAVAAWGGSSERSSNLGGEIGIGLVGALLLVSSVVGLSKGYYGRGAGMGALSLLIVWYSISRVRARFSGPVGTFTLATDAFLVLSDGGTLKVVSLAHVTGHELTTHLKNGIYAGTILRVKLADNTSVDVLEHLDGEARAKPATSKLFAQIIAGSRRAATARAAGTWSKLSGADMFPLPGS